MNESLGKLEAELSAMQPRGLDAELLERIDANLAEASDSRCPDRFLLSAVASGAMAACLIVVMLLKPSAEAFTAPAPVVAVNAISDPPRAGDYSLIVARADALPPFDR